jgi:hypothetical protein
MTHKEKNKFLYQIGKMENKMDEMENNMDENRKYMENIMLEFQNPCLHDLGGSI